MLQVIAKVPVLWSLFALVVSLSGCSAGGVHIQTTTAPPSQPPPQVVVESPPPSPPPPSPASSVGGANVSVSVDHGGQGDVSGGVGTVTEHRCNGIAGLRCPAGLVCIDNPNDGCDPTQGGRDCIGLCVQR